MTRSTFLVLMLCTACRFGGPDGDLAVLADNEVADDDAGVPDGETVDARAPTGVDARVGEPDARGPSGEPVDARAPVADSSAGAADASRDAALLIVDAALQARSDASIASCDAPPDLTCDPVSGEGCSPLLRCVADAESSTPAASCVFIGLQLSTACSQDALRTTCPSQQACVEGQCRKYCYCDADCEQGAACTGTSGAGSARFRVCEPQP